MTKTPKVKLAAERFSIINAFRSTLDGLDKVTSYFRNLIINLAFMIAFFAIVPLVGVEMFRDRVTIEPINVPSDIADLGLTSEVAANRLWDALQAVGKAAQTDKEQLVVLPQSRRVEFAFPDSGFSFESLIYHVRRFAGLYETRIAGEFICTTSPCTKLGLQLRLRLVHDGMDVIELPPMQDMPEREYLMTGAAELLRHLDPFVAAAYLLNTDPEHALASLRKIVKTKHKDAKWAQNLIGLALEKQGYIDKAETSFREALAIDPKHMPALINLGRLLAESGNAAKSLEIIDRAIAQEPMNARAWVVRGLAYQAANDPAQALAAFKRTAEIIPESSWPFWRIGYFLYNQGDNAGAKAHYEIALENDPDFVEARYGLAAVALATDDRKELLHQYTEVLRMKPNSAAAMADVALAQALNKKYTNAMVSYMSALKIEPENANWHWKLGQLQRDDSAFAVAEKSLLTALKINPDLTEIYFDLGSTYQRMGRKVEAKTAYETFLEKHPDSAYAALAKIFLSQL